ncbi:cytochrome P450 [Artemisia annua]|uniref:Cytochrome P450 n=1 Tax=Artemisia annua TaxID=35608 RepID=A0A2U1NA99_ARTAN|nr:cytochrome P450 [Artemisia annua]
MNGSDDVEQTFHESKGCLVEETFYNKDSLIDNEMGVDKKYVNENEELEQEIESESLSYPPGFENLRKENCHVNQLGSGRNQTTRCGTFFGKKKDRKTCTQIGERKVEGIWSGISDNCFLINVYAPQDVEAKKRLWEDITRYLSDKSGHFILFGDFNEVRYESERFGSMFNSQGAENFNEFISQLGLLDLNIGGRNFTWMNKMGTKMSKLDRFLLSESVLNAVPNMTAVALDQIEEFNDVMVDSFNSFQNVHGSALVNFKNKLKHIKGSCRAWHKEFKEKKSARYKVLSSSIGEVERKMDEKCASQDEEGNDYLCWSLDGQTDFTVASTRRHIDAFLHTGNRSSYMLDDMAVQKFCAI